MDGSCQPVMQKLISSAVSIANRAGAEVRRITKTGVLGVVDKGIQDYQTEADRFAQRMIVASLSKRFPRCTIVGEEDLVEDKNADASLVVESYDEEILKMEIPQCYFKVREEDITIWVDPLDGTAEFVKGLLDHVTILIGISVDGQSVAGVINQPFYGFGQMKSEAAANDGNPIDPSTLKGRTIWGLVGMGCFGIKPKKLPRDKLIITTTASHGNANIEDSIKAINPDQVLKVGGAGNKVLLVIEGQAHSYVFSSSGCKRWDTCAPEAVLESAGGKLTTVFGDRIYYQFSKDADYLNTLGVVASTNDTVHSRILNDIPSEVKQRLKGDGLSR